jgi:lipoate-protein ligase A
MELLIRRDGARNGRENMAEDRALLEACERGELRSPLLRVYAWDPPAVSLGYHQPAASVDADRLAAAGIDLVRRPTGGAAVLHHQEWTYAVVGPLGLPGLGDGLAGIYAGLARVFVDALNELGIPAHVGGGGRPEGFVCFEALGGHEIAVEGRKLVGSAFRKGRRAFLQHGSLLRGPAHLDLVDFLTGDGDADRRRARLARRTIHLEELGRADLDDAALLDVLSRHLARRLGGARLVRPVDGAGLASGWET